jgi:hypothetical protein
MVFTLVRLNKTVKYLSIFLLLLVFGFQQPNTYDTNAKIKAVFIYNFTKYFEWPSSKKTGNFIIYIVGKNENLLNELKALAARKKVGLQDIEVKNTPNYDESINANMVYLLPELSKSIGSITGKAKKSGILLISEAANGAKVGAAINFLVIDSKQKFEYSKNNAVKAGLKANDDFKALAINVD